MSPTVLRKGAYRFYFFSREEERMHVHVQTSNGEAKFWLTPTIELAVNFGLSKKELREAEQLIRTNEYDITTSWVKRFGADGSH